MSVNIIKHDDQNAVYLAPGEYKVTYDHTFTFDSYKEALTFAETLYNDKKDTYKVYNWAGDPPIYLYLPENHIEE